LLFFFIAIMKSRKGRSGRGVDVADDDISSSPSGEDEEEDWESDEDFDEEPVASKKPRSRSKTASASSPTGKKDTLQKGGRRGAKASEEDDDDDEACPPGGRSRRANSGRINYREKFLSSDEEDFSELEDPDGGAGESPLRPQDVERGSDLVAEGRSPRRDRASRPSGSEYKVGTQLYKWFDAAPDSEWEARYYWGQVYGSYRNSNKMFVYQIVYEDGDQEDLEAHKMHKWVDEAQCAKPSPKSAADLARRVKLLRAPQKGVLAESNNRVENRQPNPATGKRKGATASTLEDSDAEEDGTAFASKKDAAAGKRKAEAAATLEDYDSEEADTSLASKQANGERGGLSAGRSPVAGKGTPSSTASQSPASKRQRHMKQLTLENCGVTSPARTRSPSPKKQPSPNVKKQLTLDSYFGAKPAGALPKTTRSTKTSAPARRSIKSKVPSREKAQAEDEEEEEIAVITEPQGMFDDMLDRFVRGVAGPEKHNGNLNTYLLPLLRKLSDRPLRVATMCSGTESPILALDMIQSALNRMFDTDPHLKKAREEHGISTILPVQHVFSCEIEPFKQAYIERNFHPPVLFRDVRELKDEQAHTAYGTMVDVPAEGAVDVLIAGTSCVDFSNLNSKKARRSRIINCWSARCSASSHAFPCSVFIRKPLMTAVKAAKHSMGCLRGFARQRHPSL
jgi:hypothetical protein